MAWAYLDTPLFRAYGHVTGPFLFIGCTIVSFLLMSGKYLQGMSRISFLLDVLFGIFIFRAAYAAPAASALFPASLTALLFYRAIRQWLLRMDAEQLTEILFAGFSIVIGMQLLYALLYGCTTGNQLRQIAFPNSSIYAEAFAMQLVFYAGLKSRRVKHLLQIILIAGGWLFLLLLNGRAAWLGAGSSFLVLAYQRFPVLRSKRILIFFSTLFFAFFFLLIRYKADSTAGRSLIYKISFSMLQQYAVNGAGPGRFALTYNTAQAAYFRDHDINGNEAMRAGNTVYAFNDLLEWWVETGLFSLVLLILLLFLVFSNGFRSDDPLARSGVNALLCTAVTAQFSYPLHFPPLFFLCLFCVACTDVAACRKHVQTGTRTRISFLCIITAGIFAIICFYRQANNLDLSQQAFLFNASGEKKKAMAIYRQLEKDRFTNGRTIYEYAKTVWEMADTTHALELIQLAKQKVTDADITYLSGMIREAAGMDLQAAADYQLAACMFPSRVRYRYACFRIWKNRGDAEAAAYWARALLACPYRELTPYIIKVRAEVSHFLAETGRFGVNFGSK